MDLLCFDQLTPSKIAISPLEQIPGTDLLITCQCCTGANNHSEVREKGRRESTARWQLLQETGLFTWLCEMPWEKLDRTTPFWDSKGRKLERRQAVHLVPLTPLSFSVLFCGSLAFSGRAKTQWELGDEAPPAGSWGVLLRPRGRQDGLDLGGVLIRSGTLAYQKRKHELL